MMDKLELKKTLKGLGIPTVKGLYVKKSKVLKALARILEVEREYTKVKADLEKEDSIKIAVIDADAAQNADLNNLLSGKNIKKESVDKPVGKKYFYTLTPKSGKLDRDTVTKLLKPLGIDWEFCD